MIRRMTEGDLPAVLAIYEEGLATGAATFETSVPTIQEWDEKHHPHLRYVYEKAGKVLGWITLSQVSAREVYKGVGEISVYIAAEVRGKGIGYALMERFIGESEKEGYWMLQSSVFKLNGPSIRLHERTGFRLVGIREKIAKRSGAWQDTLLFERRSRQFLD